MNLPKKLKMGTLVLEVGQCGIQIGLQAWEYLSSMQYYENNFLFRSDHDIAHSILIDTESKVVKPIFDNRKKYSYFDTKNIIYQQSGRGNNWTIGYFDSKKVMLREYEVFKMIYNFNILLSCNLLKNLTISTI